MSTLETKAGEDPDDAEEAGTDDPGDAEETTLDRDDVFHILQVQRRRWVLKYLEEYEGEDPAAMSDIAEHIAARENDTTVDAISAAERKRVYTALYQSHLPKLDDAGIVDYNQNRGIVELSTAAEQIDPYLEMDARDDITWCRRYLGLAGLGVAAIVAAALGIPPFNGLAGLLLAGILAVGFTAIALAHTMDARNTPGAGAQTPDVEDR